MPKKRGNDKPATPSHPEDQVEYKEKNVPLGLNKRGNQKKR